MTGSGWKDILKRPPTVLLYHSVPRYGTAEDGMNAAVFETHILHLKRHFSFIHAQDYGDKKGSLLRPKVLLCFDDGLRNNAEVVAPILRRHRVPAVFFISSRHCSPGKYLWFTYLRMLDRYFQGELKLNGTRIRFGCAEEGAAFDRAAHTLLGMEPYPQAMYSALADQISLEELVSARVLRDECEGMTPDQIRELAHDPLFTVAAHTCDHPFLPRCSPQEIEHQIAKNKAWLEAVTGIPACDLFAYPHGAFTEPIAEICRRLGFRYAFAASRTQAPETAMSIARVGVYQPSTDVLHMKVLCGNGIYRWPITQLRTMIRTSTIARSALQHGARIWLHLTSASRKERAKTNLRVG